MIAPSDIACPSRWQPPARPQRSGPITIPPPTPSRPDRTPPAAPIAPSRLSSRARRAGGAETAGSRVTVEGGRSVNPAQSTNVWIHLTGLWIQSRLLCIQRAHPDVVLVVVTDRG